MFKPPGAKAVSRNKGTDTHIVTIEPNGQVIWNSAFHQSSENEDPLMESDSTTYGMCWEVPGQDQLIMTFATLEEMQADNESFNPANLGKEVFALPKATLKKGLTNALNNCTGNKGIIPEVGNRTKFEEGKNLVVDRENKCITIDYSSKRQYSEVSKRRNAIRERSRVLAKWAREYYSNREQFNQTILGDEDWLKEGRTRTNKENEVKVELSWQDHFWVLIKKLEEGNAINNLEYAQYIANKLAYAKNPEDVKLVHSSPEKGVMIDPLNDDTE